MVKSYMIPVLTILSLYSPLMAEHENKTVSSCYSPPDAALSDQMIPTYNRNARIAIDRSTDFFGDVSFIYWDVGQDYMDIARNALFSSDGSDPVPNAKVSMQPFNYQPGFKVGIGFSSVFDNWQLNAEYTYLHNSNSFSATSFTGATLAAGDPVLVPNEWYVNLSHGAQVMATRMASQWKMNLDLFDLLVSRPFYQGQRLTVTPYTGLRGIWIRQRFDIQSTYLDADGAAVATQALSENSSKGWGIGPHIGADLNWLLGMGFRAELDAAASLLYTSYTTLKHRESGFPNPINGDAPTQGFLRPISQLGLGLGWGSYFKQKGYHLDFSARYDFSIFWAQNVMRETIGYLQNHNVGYANPIGNLNLHGLTLTARFDF